MSYSGQCLMSSFIGGRSGNRGACAQPCRLPYSLVDENGKTVCESKYLLSLKDLCLINEIGDLKRLGVKSLKIEGRMKNAGYVAMTAHLYDKYRNGQRVDSKDIDDLQSVFSRDGFTDGYYKNLTGRGMLNFDKNNDDVYKTVSDKAKQRAEDLCRASQRKVLISGSFEAAMGQQAKLCVWDSDGNCVSSQSNSTAENALNVALDEERIRGQITKTGGTPFEFEDLIVNIDEGISLPIKDINEMRRIALSELEQQRSRVIRKDNIPDFSFSIIKGSGSAKLSARALTYEQIKVLEKTDAARIYMPPGIYDEHRDEFSSNRFFVSLPGIERFGRQTSGYANISVSNFSQIYDTASHKHAGSGLNVFNSAAVKLLKELGFESVCLSQELNICQIRDISKDIDTEVMVYGYTPVMTVQNCIIKSAHNKCQCHRNEYFLKDRKGAYFKVMADKQECTNVILNSTPVYMGDKKDDIRQCGVSYALMNFTVESPEETEEIFNLYKNGKSFNGNFTRGHFYRGV